MTKNRKNSYLRRYLLSGWLSLFLATALMGQVDFKEEKAKVNAIKRNTQYVYGEGIADTEAEARELAEQNLRQALLQFISEKKDLLEAEAVLVNAAKKNSSQIKLKRGTMERVFLFVKKDNIFPSENPFVISQEPQEEEAPTDTEVVQDKGTGQVPKEPLFAFSSKEKTADRSVSDKADGTLKSILRCENITALRSCLNELKQQHKVMWGELKQDFKPSWYLIPYEGEQIKAVLDKGLQKRNNLLTGEREEMGNYSGLPKIWFIIYN